MVQTEAGQCGDRGKTEVEVAEALVRERPAEGHPAGCTLITPLNLGTPVSTSQFSLGTEVGMGTAGKWA